MNSRAHFPNLSSLNELNPDYKSVVDKCMPITEEILNIAGQTSVCCDENPKAPLNCLSVERIKMETLITDGVGTSGEQYCQGIFMEAEEKLENVDYENDSSIVTDKNFEDSFMEDNKPNIPIKSDPDECGIIKCNFYATQTLTNTGGGRRFCEENKTLYCVKDEELTIDDNSLEKKEAAESKLCDPKFFCAFSNISALWKIPVCSIIGGFMGHLYSITFSMVVLI